MEKSPDDRWITIVPGIRRQTIASGAEMMQMRVRLDAGSHLPEHQHPHEQLTYVVSGRLHMRLAGTLYDLGAGEAVNIPGGTPHSADVPEDSFVIDTFSPPRDDYLALDRAAAGK